MQNNWQIQISVAIGLLAICAMLGPFHPAMPVLTLDSSWAFAMNEAVSRELRIGQDIVFTFGPYASVYTKLYHPKTNGLMIVGALYVSIVYFLAYSFALKKERGWTIAWSLLAISFFANPDALMLSIPLLININAVLITKNQPHTSGKARFLKNFSFFFLLSSLGFLPLIKGSFLPYCLITLILVVTYLAIKRRHFSAVLAFALPLLSAYLFWTGSGQPSDGLVEYFLSLIPIIAGYTGAMATDGLIMEEWIYLAIALTILISIKKLIRTDKLEKTYFILNFLFFLFFCFKAGFTRHDGHGYIALYGLLLALLAYYAIGIFENTRLFYFKKISAIAIFIFCIMYLKYGSTDQIIKERLIEKEVNLQGLKSLTASQKLHYVIEKFGFKETIKIIYDSYSLKNSWLQGSTFTTNSFAQYQSSLDNIKAACKINTHFSGTVDLFSYHQACVLANGWRWAPRPVFQSYSAYKPELIKLNADYFRNETAPDNIIFRLETIDKRLPSMDDGLSWLSLLDNYTIVSWGKNESIFKKNTEIKKFSSLHKILEFRSNFDQEILLPNRPNLLFLKIYFRPSLAGKISTVIYKQENIVILIKLNDGTQREFRVIPEMMETGLLISPLVETNQEFSELFLLNSDLQESKKVKSFRIKMPKQSWFWQPELPIELQEYVRD